MQMWLKKMDIIIFGGMVVLDQLEGLNFNEN